MRETIMLNDQSHSKSWHIREYIQTQIMEKGRPVKRRETTKNYVLKSIFYDIYHLPKIIAELEIYTKLRNPPSLLPILKYHVYNKKINIELPYVEGMTLTQFLTNSYPPLALTCIFYQIIQGIGILHQHGLAHKNLTPNNILILEDGNVLITDIGLYANINTRWSPPEVQYIPPEQTIVEEVIEEEDPKEFKELLTCLVDSRDKEEVEIAKQNTEIAAEKKAEEDKIARRKS